MAESKKFTQWGTTCEEIITNNFPLHRSCRDGDIESLCCLLSEGQHGVYVEDSFYGWTPAHWAAYFGKLNCLMRLHETGVNCDSATERLNQTPIHIAAFAGQVHCVKWLLHCGARIDRQDYLGETPIHKAARTGSMECCSLLVSHGARLYIRNINGATPAEVAHDCGFMECAKYLEAAAKHQQLDAKGIYEKHQQSSELGPRPEDITTHPPAAENTVTLQNGVSSFHNGEDCEMTDENMDSSSPVHSDPGIQDVLTNGDITINHAISINQVPVAGRKRTIETTDDHCYKRQRTTELVLDGKHHPNGFLNVLPVHANGISKITTKKEQLNAPFKLCQDQKSCDCAISGYANDHSPHNGSFHNVGHAFDPNSVSSSADEHKDSILLAQGYDNMCCEAMLTPDF